MSWFKTYPGAHQRRRLLKRDGLREKHRRLWIRHHELGKGPVMPKARRLAILTKPRVELVIPLPRQAAPNAPAAGVLEVEHAHTVPRLPTAAALGPHTGDNAGGLVGWDHGEIGGELALQHLEIGVAEAGGVDADEQLILPDFGDRPVS